MSDKKWVDMKVILKWDNEDQYWMNPENLVLALRKVCPNTKFECKYLIHPNKDRKKKTFFKIQKYYRKSDKRIVKKLRRRKTHD